MCEQRIYCEEVIDNTLSGIINVSHTIRIVTQTESIIMLSTSKDYVNFMNIVCVA